MHIQRVGTGAPDFELAVRASLRRLLTLLRRRLPKIRYIRCISTTPLRKMTTRSFLALHEAAVSGQSSPACAGCAACLGVAERGEASDGETATVCTGAVVRSGGYWRLRVVGDRDSRDADLEPRGGRRRERCERWRRARRRAAGTRHGLR